jgi:hypothetical protein
MNPRWINCARVKGIDPASLTAFEFIVWNLQRLAEWRTMKGIPNSINYQLSGEQLDEYDAWLDAYPVDKPEEGGE